MAYNPTAHEWDLYKVGTRVRVKTGIGPDDPKLKGVIVAVEPPITLGGSLEYYRIKLDEPSYRSFKDRHLRPGMNPKIWRTDSSMCEPIHVLEDLSEL